MIAKERLFESRGALASALAADVAARLAREAARNGQAVLAVSGGTTPRLFFETLSRIDIPWSRITITLVDDRQVDETSERSNARFVRTHLLQNRASNAGFVPLYGNPEAGEVGRFDVAILGMGNDGHTASFFPQGDNLGIALDRDTKQRIVDMNAPTAPEPRITFTLPDIIDADMICLHLEGQEKRDTLTRALGEGPVEEMPIRAVLRAKKQVTLYWCP
jgi:6-phosphogluconolactonase